MDLATFFIQLLNALQYGLLLFLIASGLTLVFGIMGVINLAHGAFTMVGAYLAWSLAELTGSFWAALALGIPLTVLLGAAVEWLFVRRLYARDHLHQVLLTFGLILILEESRSLLFGDDVHAVAVPALLSGSLPLTDTLSYPVYRFALSGACLALALAMAWVIRATRVGMMVRAGASNREMAEALGIPIQWVQLGVFSTGIALAGLAGMMAAPVSSVYPGMGNQVLILCFVVVVIGGIGSVKGAFVAALLIGLVDTFGKVVTLEVAGVKLLPQLAGMSVYLLMAAVLLWRPEGLFGRRP